MNWGHVPQASAVQAAGAVSADDVTQNVSPKFFEILLPAEVTFSLNHQHFQDNR